jgi:hypothetical protein
MADPDMTPRERADAVLSLALMISDDVFFSRIDWRVILSAGL